MSTFEKEIAELLHKAMESLIALEIRVTKLEKVEARPLVPRKYQNRSHSKMSRNPKAQELAIKMLKQGAIYKDIAEALNRKIHGFSISQAAISRFCLRYRKAGEK